MGRHGYRKKKRTHLPATPEESSKAETHKSFVFRRGRLGVFMKPLEADLRKLLHPNTAQRLKESRKNQLKDFVHIAGPLNVSHFLILTATEQAAYLRLAKVPRGPTITLRILDYSLMHDVAAAQTTQHGLGQALDHPPLVVLSNFGNSGEQMSLTAALFQGLFPPINVQKTSLAACKRVVLLSHDPATRRISLRHYSIHTAPSGVTKGVKSLVAGTALPALAQLGDVSELLLKSGYGSGYKVAQESEGEEAAESRVALDSPGSMSAATRQCRIRLHELGPRLEMEVVKAEEGLCSGQVLFHAHVQKPPEAAAAQHAAVQDREQLRTKRRQQQEDNVKRKTTKQAAEQQAKRQKDAKGKPRPGGRSKQWWEPEGGPAQPDDDRAFYIQEVGEDPGEGMNRAPRPPRDPSQLRSGPRQGLSAVGKPSRKAAGSSQGPSASSARQGMKPGRRKPADGSAPARHSKKTPGGAGPPRKRSRQ